MAIVGGLCVALGMLHVIYYTNGFLEEWDYWAGTFGLVVCALIEVMKLLRGDPSHEPLPPPGTSL